jgi:hypothetical protein
VNEVEPNASENIDTSRNRLEGDSETEERIVARVEDDDLPSMPELTAGIANRRINRLELVTNIAFKPAPRIRNRFDPCNEVDNTEKDFAYFLPFVAISRVITFNEIVLLIMQNRSALNTKQRKQLPANTIDDINVSKRMR